MNGVFRFLVFIICIAFVPTLHAQSWDEVNGIDTTLSFEHIVFTNVGTGVAIDDQSNIWLTANGSMNWEQNNFGAQSGPRSIEPISDNQVMVMGGNGLVGRGIVSGFSILWATVDVATNNGLNNAHFTTPSNGWIVGDNSTLRFTENGAFFSTQTVPGLAGNYNDIYVRDELGIIVTSTNRIGITRNGGKLWEMGATLPTNNNVQIEYGNGFYYIRSQSGVLMRSFDGNVWNTVATPAIEINSFTVIDGSVYLVGNGGQTFVSSSIGNNWQEINGIPTEIDVNDIACTVNGCYAGGAKGKMYWLCNKITVGGRIWGDNLANCTDDGNIENGYKNVTINLLNGSNIVATTTSDERGNYQFNVDEGTYTITLDDSNFGANGVLVNTLPCGAANDPNDNQAGDQNGASNGGGISTPNPIELRCGEELGPQGVQNLTIDFGLTFDCSTATAHPTSNVVCTNTQAVCNITSLEQGCHLMNTQVLDGVGGGCNATDSVTNITWFSYVGGYGDYDLEISLNGCFPGQSGQTGMKVGVVKECGNGTNIFCQDRCNGGSSVTIPSDIFEVGKLYHIWVNGCGGSICGYTMDVIGNNTPFTVPDIDKILINGQDGNVNAICGGADIVVEATDLLGLYNDIEGTFSWKITNEFGTVIANIDTDTNYFEYTLSDVSTYTVCLDKVTTICNTKTINGCNEIILMEVADEDFGVVEICSNDLVFYNGPSFVNDNPNNTDDPNGDGTSGWQGTDQMFSGTNQAMITNAMGCTYIQSVEIVELFPSPAEQLSFLVCDGDDFPLYIVDQNYFAETNNQNISINGGAENGCDSFIVLTIVHLEVDGTIQQLGCDTAGVMLEFTPTLIQNTANRPIITNWRDSNGNTIQDDGDNDPYTITVPFSTDTYTLDISITDTNLGTCDFSFDHEINFDLPTITTQDSICVGDEGSFLFSLPSGIDTPLWNVDDGNFTGIFTLNQPLLISWDTPGTKTLTLAYLQNGCYVEETALVTVLPKYESSNFTCNSGENSVTFTWPNLAFNNIDDIIVLTGQTGTIGPNSFEIEDLTGGEAVTIEISITSDICDPYTLIAVCGSEACDSIDNLPNYDNCSTANVNTVCDITTLQQGCATLDNPTTTNPGISCLVGNTYNLDWIPFTAGTGDYNLDIIIFNCNQGTPSDGVQYAIFEGCDLDNPLLCSDACTANNINIDSDMLNAGQDYVILLNGCNGSICNYSIMVNGDFTSYTLPTINDISADGAIVDNISYCAGETMVFALEFDKTLYDDIYGGEVSWTLQNLANQSITNYTSDNSNLTINGLAVGSYEVCFTGISHGCNTSNYTPDCIQVNVLEEYNPPTIICTATVDMVTFTWDTQTYHSTYDVNVNTGQTGTLSGNTFTVTGLQNNEVVEITLVTQVIDGCSELVSTASCTASDCPMINILLDILSGSSICLTDTLSLFNINAIITPITNGVGVYSGPGIIDTALGTFDPAAAGVGSHTITYTFTSDIDCEYTVSITIDVVPPINASFNLSADILCVSESLDLMFDGDVNTGTDFVWNFGQGNINSGSGMGPYNLTFNNTGQEILVLNLNDPTCGLSTYSDTIMILECSSCICEELIDTTIFCSTVFDPVCGCDGVTYSNACNAQFYGGVRTWTNGPCNNTAVDTINAFCDDGNPLTENDHIDEMCNCVGDIIISTNEYKSVINIYPNPTNGVIYFDGLENGMVKVYDLLGQTVIERDINAYSLNISSLPKGMYMVKVANYGVVRIYKD